MINKRLFGAPLSLGVRDKLTEKIRYITYYDLDQQGYRCAVGKVWITGQVA